MYFGQGHDTMKKKEEMQMPLVRSTSRGMDEERGKKTHEDNCCNNVVVEHNHQPDGDGEARETGRKY